MDKAVFLDRDGTINVDHEYVHKIKQWEFIENAEKAISILKKAGFIVIIITSQSGIGRGYYSENDMNILHEYMITKLQEKGGDIDKIYFCPHKPDDNCDCRKPSPKLINEAIKEFDIDISRSFYIGDKMSDINAAINAFVKPLLVLTGKGKGVYEKHPEIKEKCKVFKSIYEASEYIVNY